MISGRRNTQRKKRKQQIDDATRVEDNVETSLAESSHFFQKLISSKLFIIIENGAIIVNSIILALPNYSRIDENGQLSTEGSIRNSIFINSEMVFIVFFTIELLLKVLGMGFLEKAHILATIGMYWMLFLFWLAGYLSFCRKVALL